MSEPDEEQLLHAAMSHMLAALDALDKSGEEFVAAKLSLAIDVLDTILTACEHQPDV